MNGLILIISAVMFSLMLGASSGVATGFFVSSESGINFFSSNSSLQSQQSPSKSSTKNTGGEPNQGVHINPQRDGGGEPIFSGDSRSAPSRQIRQAQGDDVSPSETRSLAETQAQVRVDSARSRSLLLNGGNPVQVSNQIQSTLLTGACGDSNADGAFDVGDVVLGLQLAVGLGQQTRFHEIFGDLNSDEALNILDTIKALDHLVSQDPIPNECGPFVDQ